MTLRSKQGPCCRCVCAPVAAVFALQAKTLLSLCCGAQAPPAFLSQHQTDLVPQMCGLWAKVLHTICGPLARALHATLPYNLARSSCQCMLPLICFVLMSHVYYTTWT